MAIIKDENGKEFYTNSEYYEKQEADNFVVKTFLGSLFIAILFYTTFYQYFNIGNSITSNLNSYDEFANISTVITFALVGIFYYRAKNKNIFYTGNVLILPFLYAIFLAITVFAHSYSLKNYGSKYSFSTYFETNVVTKDNSSDIDFVDKFSKFIEASGK